MTSLSNSHASGAMVPFPVSWRLGLVALLGVWIVVIGVYYETSVSLVMSWYSSDLYSHGFLILPLAGYLLWRRRDVLKAMSPRPFIWGIVGIGFFALAWLIGEATATNTLRHLGLIGMLQGLFVTLFGLSIARRSLYPLLYLFFAVPFGSGLIEPLQQLTAVGTVRLIDASGIPVHLDGYLLVIPAGRFHIAEACSGVRFLLSTVALAWLAADILYRSLWRRVIFFGLAIVLPLIANTLRAYLILLIASVSGMDASSAFDHVTYGLVFLGFVLLLLLLLGWSFRDRGGAKTSPSFVSEPTADRTRHSVLRLGIVTALALLIALPPSLLANNTKYDHAVAFNPSLEAPNITPPWRSLPDAGSSWRPSVLDPDAEILRTYVTAADQVDLYIGYYAEERQGAEAVNELTDWAGRSSWRKMGMTEAVLTIDGRSIDVPCVRIASGREHRLVCYWYWIDQRMTASPYLAKLLQARMQLFGGLRSAAVLAIASSYEDLPEEALQVMRSFFDSVEPLDSLLVRTAKRQ